jgi:hypothetical protein
MTQRLRRAPSSLDSGQGNLRNLLIAVRSEPPSGEEHGK